MYTTVNYKETTPLADEQCILYIRNIICCKSCLWLRLPWRPCGPRQLSRYSDSLQVGRPGNRIPVVVRYSAPVQTGSGAHPVSYTMGTGSFQGVKQPGRGVSLSPSSSAEVGERVELYICSLSGPSWPVLEWNLTFTLFDVILGGRFLSELRYGRVLPLTVSSLFTDCFSVWLLCSLICRQCP